MKKYGVGVFNIHQFTNVEDPLHLHVKKHLMKYHQNVFNLMYKTYKDKISPIYDELNIQQRIKTCLNDKLPKNENVGRD